MGPHPGDVLALVGDGAGLGVQQTRDGFQVGGFARAVGADQGDDLAFVHMEGDVLDGVDGAVVDVDAFNAQHSLCHGSALLLAQVGFDDLGVVADLVGGALGDDPAEVQHRDALADAHDQIHVMLDQQDGDVELVPDAADDLHQLGGLGGVHAGGGLVQQQQLGAGGQGADDLQPALGAVGQAACLLAGQVGHVEDVQKPDGLVGGLALLLPVAG